MTFEIATGFNVVIAREIFAIFNAERFDYVFKGPDVELAFFAFRIGIERSRKSPLTRRHLALQPGNGFTRALRKEQCAAALPGKCQQFQQLRVVVEHFLEMWDQPFLVHRIAREAATEMIVNPALAHLFE